MTAKIKLAANVLQRSSHMAITSFPLLNNSRQAFKGTFRWSLFLCNSGFTWEGTFKVPQVHESANYQCASHFGVGVGNSIDRN